MAGTVNVRKLGKYSEAAQSTAFASLLDGQDFGSNKVGTVVKAKVVGVDRNFVIVDVGLKSEGKINIKEFSFGSDTDDIEIGSEVSVFVESYENRNGEIVLSREKALKEIIWEELEKVAKDGTRINGVIKEKVRGGYQVDLRGASAFLPASQVDVKLVRDIRPLMGIVQPFKILKLDKTKGSILVSRRAILEEVSAEEKNKLLAEIHEGMILDGVVKNITNYGVFVDVGGIDGLLHSSDISHQRINHPTDVLEIGQRVKVKVIKFQNQRIALGMKQLEKDPWEDLGSEINVGDVIGGTVTKVNDYGIYVALQNGIEGFVHQSDIAWRKNPSPYQYAKKDDKVDVKVLSVDKENRKIALSMKLLQDNPWDKIKKDFAEGTVFDGEIVSVTGFGIFIKMLDDIDGMVSVNDLKWGIVDESLLKNYNVGDSIQVKVLSIIPEKEKISLGIKQLTDDPFAAELSNIKEGDVVECTVTETKEDGIYVVLKDGSLPGVVRKPMIAYDKKDRKTSRFPIGENIEAKVVGINRDLPLLILSIRDLEAEEQSKAKEKYSGNDAGASLGDILEEALRNSKK